MPTQTNEQALEAAIEKKLTGSCLEELKQQGDVQERAEVYRSGNGYYMGYANDFNTKYAIDEVRFWHFLATTQAEELAKIQKQKRLEVKNSRPFGSHDQKVWRSKIASQRFGC